MKRYPIFRGKKNQYCENDCTTKGNIQIQSNYYQITNGIIHRTKTQFFKVHLEPQKIPNIQSSQERTELEESPFLASHCTTKLQSSRQYGTGTKTEV